MTDINRDPRFSYSAVNGEPLLVLLPVELELTTDGLEDLIRKFQIELTRMRAARDNICQAVSR